MVHSLAESLACAQQVKHGWHGLKSVNAVHCLHSSNRERRRPAVRANVKVGFRGIKLQHHLDRVLIAVMRDAALQNVLAPGDVRKARRSKVLVRNERGRPSQTENHAWVAFERRQPAVARVPLHASSASQEQTDSKTVSTRQFLQFNVIALLESRAFVHITLMAIAWVKTADARVRRNGEWLVFSYNVQPTSVPRVCRSSDRAPLRPPFKRLRFQVTFASFEQQVMVWS